MVGTWAISPAPTTSPIRSRPFLGGPARRAEHAVLDVAVEVEGPVPAFAADARLAVPAERCPEVAHEEAVDPHGAGVELRAHPLCPLPVSGHERRSETEAGVVGHPDSLLLRGEGLEREHR